MDLDRGSRGGFGVVATLATDAAGHEVPAAGWGVSETASDANEAFELEERLAQRGRAALSWSELLAFLATVSGVAPTKPEQPSLQPADVPIGGARALGYGYGVFEGMMRARRETQRTTTFARLNERASIRAVLEDTPGTLASTYLTRDSMTSYTRCAAGCSTT